MRDNICVRYFLMSMTIMNLADDDFSEKDIELDAFI